MQCPECDTEVKEFERFCPACDHDCGYPNVQAARKPEEQTELARRYQAARAVAVSQGYTAELEQFRQAVCSSKPVLSRSLSQTMEIASGTIYAISPQSYMPKDDQNQFLRPLSLAILFPFYGRDIRFAALSLDGRGMSRYGECSIVLKEGMIRHRATVFEENSVAFLVKKNLGIEQLQVPPGYRATWEQRDKLAVAKLGTSLKPGMRQSEFPRILLKSSKSEEQEDFIEVHIYGPLNRQSIEHVIVQEPKRRADLIVLKELERKLSQVGVTIEVE